MSDTERTEQTTEVVEQKQTTSLETDFSKGVFASSNNFKMAWQMAQALASSSIVPQNFQKNPSNCLIAIEQANRLNMSPFLVMQNLYVIQGRPSWSSQWIIAAVNNSGKFDIELQFDEKKDKDGKPFSCQCWTMQGGRRIEGITIDMDLARAEGWTSKNGSKWRTMPQVMLRYRAASFFARMNCPEVILGLYSREEAEEIAYAEGPRDIRVEAEQAIASGANAEEFVVPEE
jgi:hypothetical protein